MPQRLRGTLISNNPTLWETVSNPIYCLALGFGSGLVKIAPGTSGSLLALIFYLPLSLLPFWMYIIHLVVSFLVGIYVCGETAQRMKVKDPSAIVWDEVVGMWIALLLVPSKWYFIVLAFLIFTFIVGFPKNYDDNFIINTVKNKDMQIGINLSLINIRRCRRKDT